MPTRLALPALHTARLLAVSFLPSHLSSDDFHSSRFSISPHASPANVQGKGSGGFSIPILGTTISPNAIGKAHVARASHPSSPHPRLRMLHNPSDHHRCQQRHKGNASHYPRDGQRSRTPSDFVVAMITLVGGGASVLALLTLLLCIWLEDFNVFQDLYLHRRMCY